jgi:hypothetical protein
LIRGDKGSWETIKKGRTISEALVPAVLDHTLACPEIAAVQLAKKATPTLSINSGEEEAARSTRVTRKENDSSSILR